jgi:hypothetical protein
MVPWPPARFSLSRERGASLGVQRPLERVHTPSPLAGEGWRANGVKWRRIALNSLLRLARTHEDQVGNI